MTRWAESGSAGGWELGRLGFPISDEFCGLVQAGCGQRFQSGMIYFSPDDDAVPCGNRLWCKNGYRYSARGFAYRNCTDYVAWRKGMVWSQINGAGDGNARGWRRGWIDRGRTVSTVPRVGAIAWWASYGNGSGHVALVTAVNPDGSVTVEHYNFDVPGGYSVTRNMRAEAYLY